MIYLNLSFSTSPHFYLCFLASVKLTSVLMTFGIVVLRGWCKSPVLVPVFSAITRVNRLRALFRCIVSITHKYEIN